MWKGLSGTAVDIRQMFSLLLGRAKTAQACVIEKYTLYISTSTLFASLTGAKITYFIASPKLPNIQTISPIICILCIYTVVTPSNFDMMWPFWSFHFVVLTDFKRTMEDDSDHRNKQSQCGENVAAEFQHPGQTCFTRSLLTVSVWNFSITIPICKLLRQLEPSVMTYFE